MLSPYLLMMSVRPDGPKLTGFPGRSQDKRPDLKLILCFTGTRLSQGGDAPRNTETDSLEYSVPITNYNVDDLKS